MTFQENILPTYAIFSTVIMAFAYAAFNRQKKEIQLLENLLEECHESIRTYQRQIMELRLTSHSSAQDEAAEEQLQRAQERVQEWNRRLEEERFEYILTSWNPEVFPHEYLVTVNTEEDADMAESKETNAEFLIRMLSKETIEEEPTLPKKDESPLHKILSRRKQNV